MTNNKMYFVTTVAVLALGCSIRSSNNNVMAFTTPSTSSATRTSNPISSKIAQQRNHQHQQHFMSTTCPEEVKDNTSEAADQNIFGVVSDAVTGGIFSLLHAFDDCGIEDSSKNLRVLWVRALLNSKQMIKDDVAEKLLPKGTKSLVTSEAGSNLFNPIIQFTEWIQARTEFIDNSLDLFLKSPLCAEDDGKKECNVVMFGAGYDTRVLRYRHAHDSKINFIEVDLPSVVEGKQKLYEKFQKENDPSWDVGSKNKLIGFDLNDAGGSNPKSLIDTLRKEGNLKKDIPTFFVWEAVLFYVNEDAVRNIMNELFTYAQLGGGNGNSNNAETLLCFTDSLKPFVDVPFTNEANAFFDKHNLDLIEHRSRWGGAVHFALASTRARSEAATVGVKLEKEAEAETTNKATKKDSSSIKTRGQIGTYIAQHSSTNGGSFVYSYTPTQSNNPKLLKDPSFENAWYALGYSWQVDGYETAVDAAFNENKEPASMSKPYATRLWGEPVVVYRDEDGSLVGMTDACPHRSAPLSMGTVEDGNLVCFYHGWKFGKDGECVDIPTTQAMSDEGSSKKSERIKNHVTTSNCGNYRAVAEKDGIVWMWRGNVLEADVSLLPSKRKGDMETYPVDSVLDYNVDYSYIVENNLDSPHLLYLHDGSVPPIEGLGLMNKNLPKLRLTSFTDDCGLGHLGRLGDGGRPKKIIRFDPPNIVRHGGVSGFEEEFHCIPVAPHRTRVLIRQHLPKGPILSTITSIPLMKPLLAALVNSWNYHIGLEDAVVMQGQASRIEDWGAPRMAVGGLGDDLIKRYWRWRNKAHDSLKSNDASVVTPYYTGFANNGMNNNKAVIGIPTGTSFGDSQDVVSGVRADSRLRNSPLVRDDGKVDAATGNPIGTWGIKQNYVQETPVATFPPMNYKPYKNLLVLDDFVKSLLTGQEPSSTMIKTTMGDFNTKTKEDRKPTTTQNPGQCLAPSFGIVGETFGNTIASAGGFTVACACTGLNRVVARSVFETLPSLEVSSSKLLQDDSILLSGSALYHDFISAITNNVVPH